MLSVWLQSESRATYDDWNETLSYNNILGGFAADEANVAIRHRRSVQTNPEISREASAGEESATSIASHLRSRNDKVGTIGAGRDFDDARSAGEFEFVQSVNVVVGQDSAFTESAENLVLGGGQLSKLGRRERGQEQKHDVLERESHGEPRSKQNLQLNWIFRGVRDLQIMKLSYLASRSNFFGSRMSPFTLAAT
jgi:hypothetical protein